MKYRFVPTVCVVFNCKYQFAISSKGRKVLYLVVKNSHNPGGKLFKGHSTDWRSGYKQTL